MKKLLAKIRRILRDRRTRRLLTRTVSVFAAIVVFVTTYALVLPAITMEVEADCGIEAHQHDDSCYEDVLVCDLEESEGHRHSDSCYTSSTELICEIPEHRHEETCYDEEGNLICEQPEHTHDDSCYEEHRELTCGLEESEGHHHDDSCYDRVLICGKEVHTHSEACYHNGDADAEADAMAVMSDAAYTGASAQSASAEDADDLFYDSEYGNENAATDETETEAADPSDDDADDPSAGSADDPAWEDQDSPDLNPVDSDGTTADAAADITADAAADITADAAAGSTLDAAADTYVPALDPVAFEQILNKNTDIYYSHVEDGEVVEDSATITDWKKTDKNTELGRNDLLRVYLAYTIPAGSLNTTNETARYRLPSNLHLTDTQVKAINEIENGIAAQYVNYDNLEVTDTDNYHKYLGAEAVEGTRTPADDPAQYLEEHKDQHDGQEYISAVVKVENVYNDQGDYLGQDLIFTFTPYSIQKNQHEYDSTGQPTKAGQKITGWITLDFNMDQVDWNESKTTTYETSEEEADDIPAGETQDLPADTAETDAAQTDTAQTGDADEVEPAGNGSADTDADVESDQAVEAGDNTGNGDAAENDESIISKENVKTVITIERSEQTADIVFVHEGTDAQNNRIHEIHTELTLVEETRTETIEEIGEPEEAGTVEESEEPAEEAQEDTEQPDAAETGETEEAAEKTDQDSAEQPDKDSAEKPEQETKDKEKDKAPEYKDGTLEASGSGYKITLDYKADAQIPENAYLKVTEITRESDAEAYEACLKEAEKTIPADDKTTVDDKASRFFDIEILVDKQLITQSLDNEETEKQEASEDKETEQETKAKPAETTADTATDEPAEAVEETAADKTENTPDETQHSREKEAPAETAETGTVETITRKIEPAAPVSVNIQLFDTEMPDTADTFDAEQYKVVHFAEDGAKEIQDAAAKEMKDAQKNPAEKKAAGENSSVAPATEIKFEAESFSVYGAVYTVSLSTTVISASGDTYEITVTYGEDAKIPADAKLNVREILSTDEEYDSLYNSAAEQACSDAEKQGIEMPVLSGTRLFDIEIQNKDGKIEPSAPVQVDIRLIGFAAADHTSVVHFEKDGAKALAAETSESVMPVTGNPDTKSLKAADSETQDTTENAAEEKAVTEISFQTDSFSVYSVVKVTDLNNLVGNDKKFALVAGIANDPGATTGYSESWGQDYFTIIVNAHAMSDQYFYDGSNNIDGFRVEPVHAYEDGSVSYVGGDPAQWQFESAGNGKYYLKVNGKYLQRFNKGNIYDNNYGWEARLVDNRNNATPLSIDVNSDGTILIHDGGFYLHNDGNGEWNTRVFKFTNQNVTTNSQAYRFRVCQEADQFDSFAARKVSVQNLTVNDSFLIYRKFEDSQGNEQLFALASDGTFVRVYDGGDTVYWRETDKNLYWNYRLEGNYYSIYSTNPVTNETVYINPMHSSDPPQIITSEPSRLTLIGKENGDYGTAIENWDQTAYDYAGLHVTVNAQGEASLSTGTRVAGTSDLFLFAVASSMPGEVAETVETVDSEALGIHITVFDYGDRNKEYNAGDKLDSMADVVSNDRSVANAYQPHKANALVKPYLENDLPSSKTKGAMTGLFTANGSAVTYSKSGITNLFLKTYYDENGMFRYRSEDNFAYLGYDNTDFTVYRQAATPYPYDTAPGHTYYTHGHYMPFNDIDMSKNVSRLMNQYGNAYQNGEIVGELPVGDGRTYEDIYGTQGIPNFYTGMKLEADFTQLKDGITDSGDPMVFKFTGDDDMWVYIDGVLVLDIGGIHEPLSGSIDFSTGKVNNPTGSSLAGEKTLYDIFMAVLNNNSTPQAVKDKINSITWKDVDGNGTPDTFADYSNHEFKAFYMERGAGASNLDIQFNLKVVRPDEFVVEKKIADGVDPRFVNQEYKFQATFKDYIDNNTVKPLFKGQTNRDNEEVCTGIYYKDRKDENGDPVEVPVDQDGYFVLKAGEAAVFKMADRKIEYLVKEVEIDPELTEKVEVNGQVVTVNSGTAEAAYARVGDRSQLNYKNHPFLQNLNIIKHLLPQNTQPAPGDVFEFRVYLESTVEVDGETVHQLVPYSYGPYYVTKIVNGQTHYYTLTGENNAPVDKGTEPVVCSTTGRSGSINSIPPEYTVVIPNLAVGTHFYIEERRDNIPAGYIFDHEDLIADTYDQQTLGDDEDIISRILARDEQDHQAFDHDTIGKIKKGVDAQSEVFNRKVNVNVQKRWLKLNGQAYSLEEARQLPGSTNAVITAELWRKKNAQEGSGESETPVTVTFMVNTTGDSEYRQVSEPVTVKKNSTLEFSLGANKTSQAQEIHTVPDYSVSRTSVISNPKIHYSNGRQKDKWSKYTISGIAEDTIVYATFDAAKVSSDFVGLYIASMEEPGSSETPVEEKVADITLNDGNGWLQQLPMEQGYTYFLMNVAETGLEGHSHEYTFIDEPAVTTDENGNLTLAVANKYREPINVTVQKVWSPALTSEEENNAQVTVELHRYAKKTKGLLGVTLKDNYGAPIEGAKFKLYKNGAAQEQEYTTDVNGKVTAANLEPGTYYFKQISTPEGYRMSDSAPQTEELVVVDNSTARQEKHCELQNEALETNGVATLTLVDNTGAPIQGAKYNLIKKEGNTDVIIKEGLETDPSGKITVAQLKAGTYYFFETEPPADYNLPDEWQNTDFTVLEHPGTVQYFNVNMVNNLKGKGYVDVLLTGPQGPVSGATFELYKGNEKLEEGTTDNEGKLTFGNPDRLHAGTYIVKQITTDSNLLPASQQSFTIQDNGDANQHKELTFNNTYRGMGTATVTLTRKDNNNPISGATFELYKDGEKLMEKTTDSNGQLTFGDPDKLPVGNYSIKQVSTETGLEPVVNNWPFAILENGDPNQTHNWNVQNEDNAGNVTIKLWRKQGLGQYNWEQVGDAYTDLKPGKTYYFSAELKAGLYPAHCWYLLDETENNYNRNLQAHELTGINGGGTWDSSTNTYHFTITPAKDNTTYSFVLATDWGINDIISMTMDESSRQAAAPASNLSRSQQAEKVTASKARLLNSGKASAQVNADAQSETQTSGNRAAASVGKAGSITRDASTAVNPSGPPSNDYIVDSSFTETYTIKKGDNWKHVFENLDKCDLDENPYYYYVVETQCLPDSYHVVSYGNDNLTDTGTITVTNELKPGALTIEKKVTVNHGAVPNDANTIADGDYTFSVTGPDNYNETVTITVSQGATASQMLENLRPGQYTITETGTTNKNGISLVTEPVVLTVAPDSTAAANTASFTNDLETTSIKVKKQWMNAEGNPVNNTNSVITFTLNQVSYIDENDSTFTEMPYAGEYTNQIVGNGEVVISNLPVRGTREDGTPVFYDYTIRENQDSIPGYHDTYGTSDDGKEWTIYNTPAAGTDQYNPLSVTKQWQDMDGTPNNDVHSNDEITFTVTRHAVATTEYVPVTLSLFNSDSPSTAAQVKTYFVKKNNNVTLRFYNGDSRHFLTLSGAGSANGRYIGEDRLLGVLYDYEAAIRVNGPMNISAQLSNRIWASVSTNMHDTWVENAGHANALPATTKWDYSISAVGNNILFEDAKDLAEFLKNGTQLENQPTYTYTMKGGNQITEGTDFNPNASNWVATLSDLPTYVKVGDHYETYTYTISEVKVNGKTVSYSQSDTNHGSTDDYLVTVNPENFTITNKDKPVHIEFTKQWLDVAEQVEAWPDKTITVTIKGSSSDATATKEYVYQIRKNDVTAGNTIQASSPADAPALKVESIAGYNYKFSLDNLPRTDDSRNAYTYTISETDYPEGYEPPAYFDSNGDPVDRGVTKIESGGTIKNAIAKYELPNTGGPGTRLIYILGGLMTILAAGFLGVMACGRRKT